MKAFIRTAAAMGFALAVFAPLSATETNEDEVEIQVVNGHNEDVRVFAESADGRLVVIDRIRRGETMSIEIPAEITASEYRLKFVRVPSDIWDYASDLTAVKTAPIVNGEIESVTVRLASDLSRSGVDVTRRIVER